MNSLITITLILFTGFQPLKWSDFKAKPYTKDVALTVSRIDVETEIHLGMVYNTVVWKIEAVFDSDSSFTRTSSLKTLEHEQGHWLITQAYAKKIRRFLEPYQDCKELKSKSVEIVIDQYVIEWRRLQKQYDTETAHSTNEFQQRIWNKKIKYLYNEH